MWSRRLPIVWSLLALTPSFTRAADWPLFRSNALQTGVVTAALPETLAIRWQVKVKDGVESTAAIDKHVVYVGGLDGQLQALELATGKQKWAYKAGPFKAPVSVHGDAVY